MSLRASATLRGRGLPELDGDRARRARIRGWRGPMKLTFARLPLAVAGGSVGSLARRGSLDNCLKGHLRRILPSPCCPVSGLSGPSEPRSVPSNVIDQAPKLQTRSYFGWNKTAAAL